MKGKEKKTASVIADKKGNYIIEGTTMKVEELVAEKIAYGWSPEEIFIQHPYLTMSQIYSALAFYSAQPEFN